MYRIAVTLLLVGLGLGLSPFHTVAQSPYEQSLKPTGFAARAVVLPPRTLGKTVLRAKSALAVAIEIQVEDYLPRGLEPTLLIDGAPGAAASGVAGVEGRVTTLAFLVERPEVLKEGATLSVQMGDDVRTRARVPGALRRESIQPLDRGEAQRWGVPTLAEWLGKPPSN